MPLTLFQYCQGRRAVYPFRQHNAGPIPVSTQHTTLCRLVVRRGDCGVPRGRQQHDCVRLRRVQQHGCGGQRCCQLVGHSGAGRGLEPEHYVSDDIVPPIRGYPEPNELTAFCPYRVVPAHGEPTPFSDILELLGSPYPQLDSTSFKRGGSICLK